MSVLLIKLTVYTLLVILLYRYIINFSLSTKNILNYPARESLYTSWDSFISTTILGKKVLAPAVHHYICELITELLEWHRRSGVDILDGLTSLRGKLKEQLSLERRVRDVIFQGVLQNLMVAGIVWLLIISFNLFLEVNLTIKIYLLIALWQITGIITFIWLCLRIFRKQFEEFASVQSCIIKLISLHEFACPYAEMLQRCGYNQLKMKSRNFDNIKNGLEDALRKHLDFGVSISRDLALINSELESVLELVIARFKKHLEVIKFAFLVLFQVLCYFFLLYQVVHSFIFEYLK
jgi:hypothetical protein